MAPSRAIRPLQNICASCARHRQPSKHTTLSPHDRSYATESPLPRVAQPTFWASLIPKPLRRTPTDPSSPTPTPPTRRSRFLTRPRDWNPFTIFILLGILVGSNSIQILTLRNETLNFSRKTTAKLDLLREVVQRVKRGEVVDVRGLLGTGDEGSEVEWERVVRELEEKDGLWEGRGRREARRLEKVVEEKSGKREDGEKDLDGAGSANERKPKFLM